MADKLFTYVCTEVIEGLDTFSTADAEWFNKYSKTYNSNHLKLNNKTHTTIDWSLNEDLTITITLVINRQLNETETEKFNSYIEDLNRYNIGKEFREKYEYMHKDIRFSRRKLYLTLIDDSEPVGYAVKQFQNNETNYYKAFMYDITNEFKCEHCPENKDLQGKFPCGQQNCWVTVHCEDD